MFTQGIRFEVSQDLLGALLAQYVRRQGLSRVKEVEEGLVGAIPKAGDWLEVMR